MGDTGQHGKLGFCAQTKSLRHPGEEMSQTVMPSLDSLGDTGTTRSKRQRSRRVGAEGNTSSGLGVLLEWRQDIFLTGWRTCDSVWCECYGWY